MNLSWFGSSKILLEGERHAHQHAVAPHLKERFFEHEKRVGFPNHCLRSAALRHLNDDEDVKGRKSEHRD